MHIKFVIQRFNQHFTTFFYVSNHLYGFPVSGFRLDYLIAVDGLYSNEEREINPIFFNSGLGSVLEFYFSCLSKSYCDLPCNSNLLSLGKDSKISCIYDSKNNLISSL